ncbi:DNA sulfur modification protein DndB, partial [Pseudomonas aeruginosa]|uniref:DNA sulfur modification protein DndB n=1 Tax=Pseudomonas aeruginosa TaxID=287 RepID=UPI001F0FCB2A
IDFDLLMQRDIDEDRVKNKIAPYLDPGLGENGELKNSGPRALFFPPLLVAIAPVEGKEMKGYYEDEVCEFSDDKKIAYRKWGKNLFKITYQISKSANAPLIDTFDSEGNKTKFYAKPGQVIFEGWKAKGTSPGVRLIVIDGQHRLKALQEVYKRGDGVLDDLLIPICLLYAPKSQYRLAGEGVLSVPEVFRQLFVDVNNTAETVGGHFNILLKDNNIGSLICRKFCAKLLAGESGRERLAVVEWNTKKFKDSTNIVRRYSLTSIGVIEKALRENFKKASTELDYWLNLNGVQDSLYPSDQEKGSFECPVVDWDTFNSRQRLVLSEQVSSFAVPLLEKVFFKSNAYSFVFATFKQKLDVLEKKCDDPGKGLNVYTAAYEQILDYMQIPVDKTRENREALAAVRELGEQVALAVEEEGLEIILYALYQRALFALWFDLLKIGNLFNVQPNLVGDILVIILNEAHSSSMRHVFNYY